MGRPPIKVPKSAKKILRESVSASEAGRRLGIAGRTARKWARGFGIKLRTGKPGRASGIPKEKMREYIALADRVVETQNLSRVAKEVGVTKQALNQLLRKHGLVRQVWVRVKK
jgi:transposase